jgi:hypothetical protein
MKNVAVPNDAGLGPPPLATDNVGFVDGFSKEFERFATRMTPAYPQLLAIRIVNGTKNVVCSRSIDLDSFLEPQFAFAISATSQYTPDAPPFGARAYENSHS